MGAWKWKPKRGKLCYSLQGVKDEIDDDEACELVNGMELSIGEEVDHSIPAYLFKAVKNNNGTAILLLSDLFAFQDSSIRDFAYRLACNGFKYVCCLNYAPFVFYATTKLLNTGQEEQKRKKKK